MPEQEDGQNLPAQELTEEETAIVSAEQPSLSTQEDQETDVEEAALPKLMELRYRITFEQYFGFQWLLGEKQFKKSIKRNSIMGIVEIGLGAVYLISLIVTGLMGTGLGGVTPYIMSLLIIGLGVYSLVYYRVMFEKRFRKMLLNQYNRMPYLQNEIVVDLYANHVTEYFEDQAQDSYFYKMKGVRENEKFFIIFLEERRCLLIPKESITPEQTQTITGFLDEVCQNFEKPRNME